MAFIKRSNFDMTEKNVVRAIASHRWFVQKFSVIMPNCYIAPDNECDVFCIQQNRISHEFEIKLSRQDFLKDAKKRIQYREIDEEQGDLFWGNEYEQWVSKGRKVGEEPWCLPKYEAYELKHGTPNYFWYILGPDVKVNKGEIPEWAGIIALSKTGFVSFKRQPKILHKKKIDDKSYIKILKKGYSRYIDGLRGWRNDDE